MGSDWQMTLLLLAPAFVAVIALVGAIALGRAALRSPAGSRLGYYVGVGFFALVFLGIGGCYATMFLA